MAFVKYAYSTARRALQGTLGDPTLVGAASSTTVNTAGGKPRPTEEALRLMSNKKPTIQDFERAGLSTPEAFEWFAYAKRKQQVKWYLWVGAAFFGVSILSENTSSHFANAIHTVDRNLSEAIEKYKIRRMDCVTRKTGNLLDPFLLEMFKKQKQQTAQKLVFHEQLFQKLYHFMNGESSMKYIIVMGERGSGKSWLLNNALEEVRSQTPHTPAISVSLKGATSVTSIVNALCRASGFSFDDSVLSGLQARYISGASQTDSSDPNDRLVKVLEYIEKYALYVREHSNQKERLVLLIDDIDGIYGASSDADCTKAVRMIQNKAAKWAQDDVCYVCLSCSGSQSAFDLLSRGGSERSAHVLSIPAVDTSKVGKFFKEKCGKEKLDEKSIDLLERTVHHNPMDLCRAAEAICSGVSAQQYCTQAKNEAKSLFDRCVYDALHKYNNADGDRILSAFFRNLLESPSDSLPLYSILRRLEADSKSVPLNQYIQVLMEHGILIYYPITGWSNIAFASPLMKEAAKEWCQGRSSAVQQLP
eukprot:gb/GECG01012870.1/.p1 GENE.gb/GECG01012870.1/~~gb/GECG01012870.1/.p1  ORF type:complete len:532 (+),score=64.93 gb/GECG01012870.1/:1-1596(+)